MTSSTVVPAVAALVLGLSTLSGAPPTSPPKVTRGVAATSLTVRPPDAGQHSRAGATGSGATGSGATGAGPALRSRWAWPLNPRPAVLRPFVPPAHAYGPGHRGLDLAANAGAPVLAVDAGTVSHVGVIAGRGTISVLHPSGIRSTYEPVDPRVRVGSVVLRGSRIATVSATTRSHCAPALCLHLGAIRGRTYLDPMLLLGRARVRLLPMSPP